MDIDAFMCTLHKHGCTLLRLDADWKAQDLTPKSAKVVESGS